MPRSFLRTVAATASLFALAACSESSPVAPLSDDAAFASGSGSSTSSTSSSSTRTRVEIALKAPAGAPFASAKGKARYSAKTGERELQIEAENIPVGTAVTFLYNGAPIGTGTADVLRQVRLNLNSTLGQTVPMVAAGGQVSVVTAAGAVIVAGAF
jgi:hypothetical protein